MEEIEKRGLQFPTAFSSTKAYREATEGMVRYLLKSKKEKPSLSKESKEPKRKHIINKDEIADIRREEE